MPNMNFNRVDASRIKFEARVNPPPESPQRGSKFGRFLSAFGSLAAPVGFASAFFFPPAALIGASAYGLGRYGSYRDASRRADYNTAETPQVYFPGFQGPSAEGSGIGQVAATDPMNVISSRQAATNDMIGQVR